MAIEQLNVLPLYESSSQFKNWRFSPSSLQKVRTDLNNAAISRVKEKQVEEKNEAHDTAPSPAEVKYLTVADELSLVEFYLIKVAQLGRVFNFKEAVISTAMTYLKRFYLRNTCMDYHPKNVMLTCLFLASKTENQVISITNFAAKVKGATPTDVLSLEFLVSQSLKFQFKVHHAHLATYGIFLDLQQVLDDLPIAQVDAIYQKANEHALASRRTDLEFLCTPSQIAMACVWLADSTVLESWLFSKTTLPDTASGSHVGHQPALDLVKTIAETIKNIPKAVDVEIVREVDKRLKYCRNPEKDPSSVLYQKRKAEAETALEDKRAAKRQKEADGSYDPFASAPINPMVYESASIDVRADQTNGVSAAKPVATPPEDSDDKRLG